MSALSNTANAFGAILQRHRTARRMSQLDLAHTCEVSARHISFLESGRAQPSRDMVMRLGEGLLLPLSARNAMLHAAGFAPAFPASMLDSAAVEPFRAVLDEMIARHAPNPALLLDKHWNVREANTSARALLGALQRESGELNIVRLLTENSNARSMIENLPEVLGELTSRVQREALEAGGDPEFSALLAALDRASSKHKSEQSRSVSPVAPIVLNFAGARLRFLTAIAHFGASDDANIRDLRLELLFPADHQTRAALAGMR